MAPGGRPGRRRAPAGRGRPRGGRRPARRPARRPVAGRHRGRLPARHVLAGAGARSPLGGLGHPAALLPAARRLGRLRADPGRAGRRGPGPRVARPRARVRGRGLPGRLPRHQPQPQPALVLHAALRRPGQGGGLLPPPPGGPGPGRLRYTRHRARYGAPVPTDRRRHETFGGLVPTDALARGGDTVVAALALEHHADGAALPLLVLSEAPGPLEWADDDLQAVDDAGGRYAVQRAVRAVGPRRARDHPVAGARRPRRAPPPGARRSAGWTGAPRPAAAAPARCARWWAGPGRWSSTWCPGAPPSPPRPRPGTPRRPPARRASRPGRRARSAGWCPWGRRGWTRPARSACSRSSATPSARCSPWRCSRPRAPPPAGPVAWPSTPGTTAARATPRRRSTPSTPRAGARPASSSSPP